MGEDVLIVLKRPDERNLPLRHAETLEFIIRWLLPKRPIAFHRIIPHFGSHPDLGYVDHVELNFAGIAVDLKPIARRPSVSGIMRIDMQEGERALAILVQDHSIIVVHPNRLDRIGCRSLNGLQIESSALRVLRKLGVNAVHPLLDRPGQHRQLFGELTADDDSINHEKPPSAHLQMIPASRQN